MGHARETHTPPRVRLIMLCPMFHHPKHMSSYNGYVTFEELVQHFIKLNGCSRQEFDAYYQQCSEERTRRSIRADRGFVIWKQDFGAYTAWVSQESNLKRKYRGLNLAIDGF